MDKNDNITTAVKQWYSDSKNWFPSGKSSASVDHKILQHGELVTGRRVLNLGCFYPEDEFSFSDRALEWTAIDFCPEVIMRCKSLLNRPNVKFLVMDMTHLDFPDDSFDVVLDLSSGDQMSEDSFKLVLKEVSRVLRKQGSFVVAFSNSQYFVDEPRDHYGVGGYARTDTPEQMKQLLEDTNLVPVEFLDSNEGRSAYRCIKKI